MTFQGRCVLILITLIALLLIDSLLIARHCTITITQFVLRVHDSEAPMMRCPLMEE